MVTTAQAEPTKAEPSKTGIYVSGFGGVNYVEKPDDVDVDAGYLLGGGLGYDFGMFRTEFEIGYRKNEFDQSDFILIDDADFSTTSFMVTGFFDIENKSDFTPYIGGGIGAAHFDADIDLIFGINAIDDSTTAFAYKAVGGISLEATNNFSIFTEYEYLSTVDAEIEDVLGNPYDVDLKNHAVKFGLRYTF